MNPTRAPLSQDFIDGFKRERAALALSEAAHEVGLRQLSVTLITKRAKMARTTFYALFKNREAAVAFAVDLGNQRLRSAIEGALTPAQSPEERIRAVVEALLLAVEKEPYLAELCLVHGRGAEGAAVPFDTELVEALAGMLRAIRRHTDGPEPGPRTEELAALGVLSLVADYLRRRGTEGLSGLGPALTEFALTPFVGPDPQGQGDARSGHREPRPGDRPEPRPFPPHS